MVSGAKDRGFAPVFFQKLQMGAESSLFAPVISPERLLTVPDGLKNVPLGAITADIAPGVLYFAPPGAVASKPTKGRAVNGPERPFVGPKDQNRSPKKLGGYQTPYP